MDQWVSVYSRMNWVQLILTCFSPLCKQLQPIHLDSQPIVSSSVHWMPLIANERVCLDKIGVYLDDLLEIIIEALFVI